ncbi:MAG: hypothetical protein IAE79_06450, partial [Anaerolinea sp.]|nr:hypothetical protein [Anaerolinea sp.]
MSHRQFIVVALFLGLFALLYPPPYMGLIAQDLPEDLVFGSTPAGPEQPDMAYQPPADADDLTDFLPPDGILMEAPPLTMTLPITPSAPVTPTLLAVSSAITLTTPITQLVSFAGGQVAVVFEQDTLTDTAEIQLTTTLTPTFSLTHTNTVTNPVDQLILHRFQLEVVQKGEVVSGEFSKPVRLILDLRPLLQQLDPTFQTWRYFLAYQDESDPDIWIEVPIDIYQADGLFSAEVTHFSNWAAGVRPERWNPSWTPPVVSSFSGAATFSYPVELPPGRNGLQPDVTLAYSSRALDGRIRDGESGPIGDGWSIGGISVVRVGVTLEAPWGYPWSLHPDKFRLILNGAGHELFPVGPTGNPTVRYYVKDAPGYFLERNYSATGVPNVDGIYWILITPDGVRYRLGYFADAEEWQHSSHLNIQGHVGHANSYSAIAWHVDTVTDSFGNQMTYHYHTLDTSEAIEWWNTDHWTSFTLTTRKNRINEIKYNYPTRVTSLPAADTAARLTSTPASRITFRPSNTSNGDDQFLINSIFIYHGGGSLPVSEYRIASDGVMINSPGCLNYDLADPKPRSSHTRIVRSIQRFVNTDGDATTQDAGYDLPPTTFYYGTNLNDLNSYNPLRHFEKNGQACFRFLYLQGYKNGYGGTVRFSYSSDNRSVGAYQYVGYNRYNWPQIGYTYSVNEMWLNDGRNPDLRTTYAYTQPCYAQWGSVPAGAIHCAEPNAPEEHGPLVGYQTTTQTSYEYDGTTPRAKQVTTFSQTATNSIGRPLQIEVKDSGNTLLTQTNHTYNSLIINGLPNMFTYTSETRSYQHNSGSVLSTRTTYEYNAANQGGEQYGNLTHIREFADADPNAPLHRVTIRHYATNTTGDYWLVAPVKAEGIYDDEGVTLIRGAWLHYDGNGSETGAPTQGALTRSRSFIPILCSAAPNSGGDGCDNTKAYQTIETTYGYDVYGNQTNATTYSDYGYRTYNSSWQQLINTSPSSARATQIAYESGYNLYPISVSHVSNLFGNPLQQTTTFQIYGFNGVAVSGFQKQPGLLKQVTGPDNVTTKYEYDPFGRLHAVYDANTTYQNDDFAGFDDDARWNGDPVTLYRYWDNSWNNATTFLNPAGNAPFYISAQQRPGSFPAPANSGSGFAFNDQTFYDGFGRPIQTRSIWHWVEGYANSREIYATTAYGANGQVACQTAPYDVPFYSDSPRSLVWPASPFLNDPCTGKPHTATTYDALGRPLAVTAPDGTAATYAYYIVNTITVDNRNLLALTNVKDANNRIVQQFSNSLGQLALVREVTGDGSGGSPYVGDADTRYYYDLVGNLVKVKQSSASNADPATWLAQTTMAYDGFGRKTGMSDPDMGNWTYAYDAAGNLTRQKDAKNQAICFRYDGLNRLAIKAQDSTPADDCPASLPTSGGYHLASYTYDTAVNGQGKVAQIAWGSTPTQNKDIFYYDTLGRMNKQDRYLDGRLYTMRTSSFDALHRPLTIVYPDNETVTYAYDREGENSLTVVTNQLVTNQLVTNVRYNARGQMTYLDRHNVADTTYLYHPQTDLSGGGLGDSNFRLKTIQHGAAGTGDTWPDFTYEYDRVGNISKMTTVST